MRDVDWHDHVDGRDLPRWIVPLKYSKDGQIEPEGKYATSMGVPWADQVAEAMLNHPDSHGAADRWRRAFEAENDGVPIDAPDCEVVVREFRFGPQMMGFTSPSPTSDLGSRSARTTTRGEAVCRNESDIGV